MDFIEDSNATLQEARRMLEVLMPKRPKSTLPPRQRTEGQRHTILEGSQQWGILKYYNGEVKKLGM